MTWSTDLPFVEFELAVSLAASKQYVYVADLFANAVLRIDSATVERDPSFQLPVSAPIALALDEKRGHLYIASASLEIISRANIIPGTDLLSTIDSCFTIPVNARSLALTPEGDVLYILVAQGSEAGVRRAVLRGAAPLLDAGFAVSVPGCSAVTVVSSIDGEIGELSIMCAHGRGVHRIRVTASGALLKIDQIAALSSGSPTSLSSVRRTRTNASIVSEEYDNPQVQLEAGDEFSLISVTPEESLIDLRVFAHATDFVQPNVINQTCQSADRLPFHSLQPFNNSAVLSTQDLSISAPDQLPSSLPCSTQHEASKNDTLSVHMLLQIDSEAAVSQLASSSFDYNSQLITELALSVGQPTQRFQLLSSGAPEALANTSSATYELVLGILSAETVESSMTSSDIVTALQLQPLVFEPPTSARVLAVQSRKKEVVHLCRGGSKRIDCSFDTVRTHRLLGVNEPDDTRAADTALEAGSHARESGAQSNISTVILASIALAQGIVLLIVTVSTVQLWRRGSPISAPLVKEINAPVHVASPSVQNAEAVTSPVELGASRVSHSPASAMRPPLTPRSIAMGASRSPSSGSRTLIAGNVSLTPPLKSRYLMKQMPSLSPEPNATLSSTPPPRAQSASPARRHSEDSSTT